MQTYQQDDKEKKHFESVSGRHAYGTTTVPNSDVLKFLLDAPNMKRYDLANATFEKSIFGFCSVEKETVIPLNKVFKLTFIKRIQIFL